MPNILIIRPSAIGDIVMASPMIRVLRRAYPDNYIAWLADPSVYELLADNPDLDEVIIWPKNTWKDMLHKGSLISLTHQGFAFYKQLRAKNFDLTLDVQGLFRSRLLAWMSGAKNRIGFSSREPGKFLMSKIVSRGPDSKTISSEYSYLMKILGLDLDNFISHIVLSKQIKDSGRQKIAQSGINSDYAVFCPFTTRAQKHWFDRDWAELFSMVNQQIGHPVVLLGGPADVSHSQQIKKLCPGTIYNLTGKTRLGESAAIISEAKCVVGVDTGLTHLGVGFNRPTVALFGATCPYEQTPELQTMVLYHKRDCSPCRRKPTCKGKYQCMQDHRPEDVFKALKNLLEN